MEKIKFESVKEAQELINEMINKIKIETIERSDELQELSNSLNELYNNQAQKLAEWLKNNLGKITKAYYYNHFIKWDSYNSNLVDYGVIILANEQEQDEFNLEWDRLTKWLSPLEFIDEFTNWDKELIEAVEYCLDYFEDEVNDRYSYYELQELGEKYDYKEKLKEFIINEISDNLLD